MSDPRHTPAEPRLPLRESLALVEQYSRELERSLGYLKKSLAQAQEAACPLRAGGGWVEVMGVRYDRGDSGLWRCYDRDGRHYWFPSGTTVAELLDVLECVGRFGLPGLCPK